MLDVVKCNGRAQNGLGLGTEKSTRLKSKKNIKPTVKTIKKGVYK